MDYPRRALQLLFGLFLYGLGIYLCLRANIGLAPWEAFSMGLANQTGLSFGDLVVITGLVIIICDFLLKEKIGFGTILNALIIGKVVDVLDFFDLLPLLTNLWPGILLLLLSQVIICLGSYYYISAGLGAGPRDALMVALGKRLPRVPIGAVRGLLEGSALLIGWLLGAKVGLGTVIAVFGIGFILGFTFKILRFDVKGVEHESVLTTAANLRAVGQRRPGGPMS